MGIQGLLPALKSIQRQVNLEDFRNQTVGIDGYCWLHRGAYGCAFELAINQPTKGYVDFCMKRIQMLLHFGITPLVVLDGAPLPAKKGQEEKRRTSRRDHRERAMLLLKNGERKLAQEEFQKCIDITPQMALEFIKALREAKIQYVVAPYEADAQLAYLDKIGLISAVITEDSDLIIFGCKQVIVKLDGTGQGHLIRREDLGKSEELRLTGFTLEHLIQVAILSGCDYLPSIHGIGLKVAAKLLRQFKSIDKVIKHLQLDANRSVPTDYAMNFRLAELTFKHQRVYDIQTEKLVPLTPFPEDILEEEMHFVGP